MIDKSIGIIGGADGPTSILIGGEGADILDIFEFGFATGAAVGVAATVVVGVIAYIIYRVIKNRKNNKEN